MPSPYHLLIPTEAPVTTAPTGSPPVGAFAFGVILPVIAVAVELWLRQSAQSLVNPFPTSLHVLLVLVVPAANAALWWALRQGRLVGRVRWLAHANALAVAIAAVYSVLFLPTLPLAVLGMAAMGIGLLPLSPLLSLLMAARLRRALARRVDDVGELMPRLWPALAAGVGLMAALEAPHAITMLALRQAASPDPATRALGVQRLRSFGSAEVLRDACQPTARGGGRLWPAFSTAVPVAEARQAYYRVTGRTWDQPDWEQRWGWDTRLGSDTVGPRQDGLSLVGSRLDGSLAAESATAYLEWSMTFRNDNSAAREARVELALPTGGVISRATLWINGEEREAAFGSTGQVRTAYQQVAVVQRRDPLLVTMVGPERALVQCFPVPARGEMKIRVGITAPLQAASPCRQGLAMPAWQEANLGVTGPTALWLASRDPLSGPREWKAGREVDGSHTLRVEAANPAGWVEVAGVPAPLAWAADPREPGWVVRQEALTVRPAPPKAVTLVVDGSASVGAFAKEMAEAVRDLPMRTPLTLVVAGDALEVHRGTPQQAALVLRNRHYIGGQDNVPALTRAFDEAGDGLLVWLHGPQPLDLTVPDALAQGWERRPTRTLHTLAVTPGPNRVMRQLARQPGWRVVPRRGGVSTDLRGLLLPGEAVTLKRTHEPQPDTMPGMEGSPHLVRLWAADEVTRLRQAGAHEPAVKLAVAHQLVTAVSGAVVLERREQYRQAGLEPVDAGTVPTVPEPETWMLLSVGGAVLAGWHWRRRRACAAA